MYSKVSFSDGDNMLWTRQQSLTFLMELPCEREWKSAVNCIKYVTGTVCRILCVVDRAYLYKLVIHTE